MHPTLPPNLSARGTVRSSALGGLGGVPPAARRNCGCDDGQHGRAAGAVPRMRLRASRGGCPAPIPASPAGGGAPGARRRGRSWCDAAVLPVGGLETSVNQAPHLLNCQQEEPKYQYQAHNSPSLRRSQGSD